MELREAATAHLKSHRQRQRAAQRLRERMLALEQLADGPVRRRVDGVGGTPKRGSRGLGFLEEREELELTIRLVDGLILQVEDGLASLPSEKRMILREFYCKEGKGKANRLAAQMHVDRATVYRLRDEALRQFTLEMYGVDDEQMHREEN